MASKLKFLVMGGDTPNPFLLVDDAGPYEAPSDGQLPHRFAYDAQTNSIVDLHPGLTDRQVQELEHAAATALAAELGYPAPPPLPE